MTDLDVLAAAATPKIVFRYKPNPLATPANDEPAMVVSALGRWVASDDYDAAGEERDRLRAAAEAALNELGVPDGNYPAPVANAVGILRAALHPEDGTCVVCGQPWPCDATVRRTKDGLPHRLDTRRG